MDATRTVRGRVSGRVQGVAYRASFKREALTFGLTGWVRNRTDGTVEFLVQGSHDGIQQMLLWASRGPAHAQVTEVTAVDAAFDSTLIAFEVRY